MKLRKILILVFVMVLCIETWIVKLVTDSKMERLSEDTVQRMGYRDQALSEELLAYIVEDKAPALEVGLYLLESKYGYQPFIYDYSEESFDTLKKKWDSQKGWETYLKYTEAIWNDVQYFPVPESTTDSNLTVAFSNSWMSERTYGGQRGHEGCDIMAGKNIAGLYPIVSMTDGVVTSIGWLEKGGWRIGITAPSGAYFYYAHLDSYATLKEGDRVSAGDLLGFMGDSGYGEEGTTGQFPVHLHVGVYIYPNELETSVNPYWILRYLEGSKVKCAYSSRDMN